MGKVEAAALIVGILMPLLVSVAKQWGWSKKVNTVVALVLCAGAGVITAYATGQLTGQAVITTVAIVISVALSTYQLYWRGTTIEGLINWKTSKVK